MDRRVKERLVGASILVVLIVLVVPELLSGPPSGSTQSPATPGLPVNAPEPVRNVTVDLATSHAPAPGSETESAPVSNAKPAAPPPLETAAPSPTSVAAAPKSPAAGHATWAVQLGSFASRDNADKLVRQLKAQDFSVYVVPGGSGSATRYRVRVGPMADRGAAEQALAKLKSSGHVGSLVAPVP
jgi:DedD protein